MNERRERGIIAAIGIALAAILVGAGIHSTTVAEHAAALDAATAATAGLSDAATALALAADHVEVAGTDAAAIADALAPVPDRLSGLVDEQARSALVDALDGVQIELERLASTPAAPPPPVIPVVDDTAGTAELRAIAAQALAETPSVARTAGITDSSARRVDRAVDTVIEALRSAAATVVDGAAAVVAANPKAGQDLRDALTAAADALAEIP